MIVYEEIWILLGWLGAISASRIGEQSGAAGAGDG